MCNYFPFGVVLKCNGHYVLLAGFVILRRKASRGSKDQVAARRLCMLALDPTRTRVHRALTELSGSDDAPTTPCWWTRLSGQVRGVCTWPVCHSTRPIAPDIGWQGREAAAIHTRHPTTCSIERSGRADRTSHRPYSEAPRVLERPIRQQPVSAPSPSRTLLRHGTVDRHWRRHRRLGRARVLGHTHEASAA